MSRDRPHILSTNVVYRATLPQDEGTFKAVVARRRRGRRAVKKSAQAKSNASAAASEEAPFTDDHESASGGDVKASAPAPAEKESSAQIKDDSAEQAKEDLAHTSTDAYMAVTLPASPPQTPKSSSESHEKMAKTPSTGLRAAVPAQPNSPSELHVFNQGPDSLFDMIRQQREKLLDGPKITVYIGSTAVEGVYKRAAMASSSVLNRHFTNNPESAEYRFEQGLVFPDAVRYLLVTWLPEACQGFEACAVRMRNTFGENVALLRAARLLGMERYASHILVIYRGYLKTELPSYEEIAIVEENASSDKDPLWTTMVSTHKHPRTSTHTPARLTKLHRSTISAMSGTRSSCQTQPTSQSSSRTILASPPLWHLPTSTSLQRPRLSGRLVKMRGALDRRSTRLRSESVSQRSKRSPRA